MTERSIRILIADDHPVVRKGIKALLDTETGLEVVGEAADGEQAVSKSRILKPDVILMDLSMPRKGRSPSDWRDPTGDSTGQDPGPHQFC